MANLYVKSIIYLASFGGIAYILQLITTPSAEKIEKIRGTLSSEQLSHEEKKKALFIRRLREAANDPTLYVPKKEQ